ncbi:acyl-CoA dehydratase activase [Selenihalanaerobacter shriftii]|uniref:CoA-substrate-specific enzyme activase, putative n=1 Tax=Selenihalanaerobacter shriftii TaxID=142842 RepID=A0A1T4QQJ3_9FIRM|nr:acyl-CoA dehydratase activase [Selenihalanaerobacter shriftii]SKA06043.1 CoA-substrate-specific enzyme activase, putative [Selenihalanaerobacter shriftii]
MNCGIDLGSRNVKIALVNDKEILEFHKYDTIEFYRQYGTKISGEMVIDFEKLGISKIESVVSTGYGRNTIKIKGAKQIPELKAHMIGALFQTDYETFTLLDLGGQDSKIIKVQNGQMMDFQTNDKCAASSGRYLENMAEILGIKLDELSQNYEKPVEINSTCAIFGESELIGKILEGHSTVELAAGVNYSIFKRIKPLLMKFKSKRIIFTGGVAHNQAIKRIIENELSAEVIIPDSPQFNGALGCALYN